MTALASWRKSSHSSGDDACVEVSLTAEQALIRDTKNPGGGTIRLSPAGWSAFIAAVTDDYPRGTDKVRPV